jgi:hypothetical protein
MSVQTLVEQHKAIRKSGVPLHDQFAALSQNERMAFAQALGQTLNIPVGREAEAQPENAQTLHILQYMTRQPPPLKNLALLGVHRTQCVWVKKASGKIVEVPVDAFDPAVHELSKKQPIEARAYIGKVKKKIKEYEEHKAANEVDDGDEEFDDEVDEGDSEILDRDEPADSDISDEDDEDAGGETPPHSVTRKPKTSKKSKLKARGRR